MQFAVAEWLKLVNMHRPNFNLMYAQVVEYQFERILQQIIRGVCSHD